MINPEHKKHIDRIRELWVESGGKLLYEAEDYGLNPYYHKASESGAIELLFDYGTPSKLCVDEGSYTPLGSTVCGDTDEFWRLLNKAYTVHIVRLKRDDSVVRKQNPIAYQTQMSGPLVALVEK